MSHPSDQSNLAPGPRSQQMAERRERILEAARGLVERGGYDGLTMRSLATASGVTVPTVYNLIGGKEAEDKGRAAKGKGASKLHLKANNRHVTAM